MKMIDRSVQDLKKLGFEFTGEQERELRYAMAEYALAACMDSAVRQEIEEICNGDRSFM